MKPKYLIVLLLALIATSVAQSDDELQIPVETDNQFPPDKHAELDGLPEGSGAGIIEDPLETTTKLSESPTPLLENIQPIAAFVETTTNVETHTSELSCPTPCVCNIEGDSKNYRVDCSGYGLTELPSTLDVKTTELILQNNNLTKIPKELSALKNVKILNLNNNQIMDIAPGSISELPELTNLALGNNRLLEYPTDLKNGFGLTKLAELDLGGNDMRTSLKSDSFSNFKALRKLTLPSAASLATEDVCASLKGSLETVCTESCNQKSFDCPDAQPTAEDDLLDFALPGLIAVGTTGEDNVDPSISTAKGVSEDQNHVQTSTTTTAELSTDKAVASETSTAVSIDEGSFRSAVIKASNEEPISPTAAEPTSTVVETKTDVVPKSAQTETKSTEVKLNNEIAKTEGEVVGATTTNTKTGGVDKSVIGMIVAGMVVVVAGITIKKNWSSIKNKFSSTPRSGNDRTGTTANGTTPEEVPLQQKSPV